MRSILLVLLLTACVAAAQDSNQLKKESKSSAEFDKDVTCFFDGMRAGEKQHQEDIQELEAEKADLRRQLTSQSLGVITAGFGFGIGLAAATALILWWKSLRPSIAKRQLTALTLSAVWIIAVWIGFVSLSDLHLQPVSLVLTLIAYSLPALLFAGITLWWLAKNKATATSV